MPNRGYGRSQRISRSHLPIGWRQNWGNIFYPNHVFKCVLKYFKFCSHWKFAWKINKIVAIRKIAFKHEILLIHKFVFMHKKVVNKIIKRVFKLKLTNFHKKNLQAQDCHLCQYNDISKESPVYRANDRNGMWISFTWTKKKAKKINRINPNANVNKQKANAKFY